MKKFLVSVSVVLLAVSSFAGVAAAAEPAVSSASKKVQLSGTQVALRAKIAALNAEMKNAKTAEEKAAVQVKIDAAVKEATDSGMTLTDVNLVLAVVQQEESTAATDAPAVVTVEFEQQIIEVTVTDPQSSYAGG